MSAIRAIAERVGAGEHPSQISDGRLTLWGGRRQSASGVDVTPDVALTVGAFYAAITLYCDTIGSLPVHVFQRGDRTRIPAEDHPNATVLTRRPNPEQTVDEFWNQVVGWQLLRANALCYVEADQFGKTKALWLIPWTRVIPARTPEGALCYLVTLVRGDFAGDAPISERVVMLPQETMHWRDWGTGPVGVSRITLAAEALGLSLTAEEFGARHFANDATPGGVLVTPKRLEEDEFETLRRRWFSMHQGVKKSHIMGILEDGVDWKPAGISARDSQLIELRKFQVEDVARWMRVPPFKIGVNEPGSVSYASAEQADLDWAKSGVMPKLIRLENVAGARLLDPDATGEFFMKFSLDAWLRGDAKTRHAIYAIGRQWGYYSANDVLRSEDQPPIGPQGDIYLEPPAGGGGGAAGQHAHDDPGALLDHLDAPLGRAVVTDDPASATVSGNGNHA